MTSKVSSQGQITLPARVRDTLGLRPGSPVRFELIEGGVLVRKGSAEVHPVDRVYGRIVLDKPVDSLLDEMRGARPALAAPRPQRSRRKR